MTPAGCSAAGFLLSLGHAVLQEPSMDPLRKYLHALAEIQSTQGGSKETSYYAPLETLLNEIGQGLSPKVRCISQLQETGAGKPDFGLFTADQFQRAGDLEPRPGQKPERGVIEVKGFDEWVSKTAVTPQVRKYVAHYGLVLVTNYWQFQLLERGPGDSLVALESFHLAASVAEFQCCLRHPQRTAEQQSSALQEFLRRCLQHKAAITTPEELAWLLASYAREAKRRLEALPELPGLTALKSELEQSLGLSFKGPQGEHFFRATLVQTLFYGVFSAWVLSRRSYGGEPYNWKTAAWQLRVPMVRALFERIATPGQLGELGLTELLDWTGAALNRVDAEAFFTRFEDRHAVQYFYEPFLKAYDPELRKELGVWYTPPEIVRYQVERVDRALKEDLGLEEGLADERVVILDPSCGTGAYLVEVLRHIHEVLTFSKGKALAGAELPRIASTRVFGFEILPAPFVISHLQVGLLLAEQGLHFQEGQRAGIYLTNALTGWDPAAPPKSDLPIFPELNQEREAAARVKQQAPILVILGNPPYNAFAGTATEEEGDLVVPYKVGLNTPVAQGGWGIRKFNLDDLYIRFFRIAERRISQGGRGVVCYISNFSYLGGPSFTVMRQRFLEEFQHIRLDCLNGDSRETGKLTPEGLPDPSVFSTPSQPEGIRVGTAICLLTRTGDVAPAQVRFRHFWGQTKREQLLESLAGPGLDTGYEVISPTSSNRFSFRPGAVAADYQAWPAVTDLCAMPPSNGLMEKRGGALIDMDREALAARMKVYFDRECSWEAYQALGLGLENPRAGIEPKAVRSAALASETFQPAHLLRYAVRPFDNQWAYYAATTGVWNRNRPSYWAQCWPGNQFLMTRFRSTASPEGHPFFWVDILSDDHFMVPDNALIPIWVRLENATATPLLPATTEVEANLSGPSRAYLAGLGLNQPDEDQEVALLLWHHVLAIGYSPAYMEEHADGLRNGWPRVPLPDTRQRLEASAKLGRRVAALLDMDRPVPGVTSGRPEPFLQGLAELCVVDGAALNPAVDLELRAGWGHAGRAGVCMPGRGRVEELPPAPEDDPLGPGRLDIFLNERVCWHNVPREAWDFTIGGYQVVKKWLSYREKTLLGRGLTPAEAEDVTRMVRRLAALVLLRPELDANFIACVDHSATWPPMS
jgi:hypothetical protein